MLIDRYMSTVGTVFILQVLQKGLLVLGSSGCLILRIDIHSFVPLSKWSQLQEGIEDRCRNEEHAYRWSHFSAIIGQHLSSLLHGEAQVFLPLSLYFSQSSPHAIHVIEHIIVHCDNMIQCDCMPFRHPQGPISEWPQLFDEILHNGPFILSCEECRVIALFWVFRPLSCEFTWSETALEQLQCRVPIGLHIHNRKYRDADIGHLTLIQLISTTRC